MTLEDVIKHCEEVAKEKQEQADSNIQFERNGTKFLYDGEEYKKCCKCAEEHRQLAEWLKELKQHREAWQKVREEIGKEIKCADVFLTYGEYKFGFNYGLGLALGVIDKTLGEVGETD